MQPSDRDLSYLWDMRKYALEIIEIIKGVPHTKFVENKTIRYAIERLLLIIGEAANHVSREFQEQHSHIEWAQIIGLRNILAHEYGEIKMDKIYLAATISIPALLENLEPLIPE
ncbi:MAG: HepT-like ribonuclease domain-containing protein [Anaerolineales bacterium]